MWYKKKLQQRASQDDTKPINYSSLDVSAMDVSFIDNENSIVDLRDLSNNSILNLLLILAYQNNIKYFFLNLFLIKDVKNRITLKNIRVFQENLCCTGI